MKDKICSILRFLIRFFRLTLVTLGGKKHFGKGPKNCSCVKETEEDTEDKETVS